MAAQPSSSAVRALALEYKSIQEEPVEGFRVKLVNEDVLFDWEVALFGPPDTLYQGGYFKVNMMLLEFLKSQFYISLPPVLHRLNSSSLLIIRTHLLL